MNIEAYPGCQELIDQLRSKADEHRRTLEKLIQEHAILEHEIRDVIGSFIKTGVPFVPLLMKHRMERLVPGFSLRGQVKAMASKLDRPYIFAEEIVTMVSVYQQGYKTLHYIDLQVPRSQRLANVVAPLTLVASDEELARATAPVVKDGTRFYFIGKEGRELFDHWRERCHTDPVCRVVLKLPRAQPK